MNIATEESIAALITGDATPDQQKIVWKELAKVKGMLAAREYEARKFIAKAENFKDAYLNMRNFARCNGLDTATTASTQASEG